jgi:hypothetical protein
MLRAVSYDEPTRELRVRFTNGGIYRYYQVPPAIVQNLLDPPNGSPGRYFNDHVRDAYDYDEER